MTNAIASFVAGALGLRRIAGPILDKELRVASRRRRNYVLRFLYLAVLTVFIALVWVEQMGYVERGSLSYRASRMSEVGKVITACIVGFQFAVSQVLSVVLLSTAVGDEIVHRTLGVLMSTPITSFQIVVGKLLGKMLQIILLLAISLPMLAVVRVFGGVPWMYVMSGLAVTLSWALFSAGVSLLLSVYTRKAYLVIIACAIIGGVLYALLPWMGAMIFHRVLGERAMISFIVNVNPFGAMIMLTGELLEPGASRGIAFYWPFSCCVALGGAAGVLAWATACVRKVSLREAGGGAPQKLPNLGLAPPAPAWPAQKDPRFPQEALPPPLPAPYLESWVRRVGDSPLLWKELRTPLFRRRLWRILVPSAALGILLITYCICAADRQFRDRDTHAAYAVIFVILGIVCTAVLSATAITTEKEARTWPILLLTPLSDWRILAGKAAGIVRRVWPVWLLLVGHVLLFAFFGYVKLVTALHALLLAAWVVAFLTCSGLYFSSRFRRTTTAVLMNLALAAAVWLVVPLLCGLAEDGGRFRRSSFSTWLFGGNPVVQTIVVVEATSGRPYSYWPSYLVNERAYRWPDASLGLHATTARIAAWGVAHCALGAFFLVRARARMRRNLF